MIQLKKLKLRPESSQRLTDLWNDEFSTDSDWDAFISNLADDELGQIASQLGVDARPEPSENPLAGLSGAERVAKIRELKKEGEMRLVLARAVKRDEQAAKQRFEELKIEAKAGADRIARIRELKKGGGI